MNPRPIGRRAALGGVVALAAGAAVAAGFGFGGGRRDIPDAVRPPATAQVTRQTLLDTYEQGGDLGYGAPATLAGRIPGIVTQIPLPGDVITRGRPVYRVDDKPVVLLFGAVTAYRTLAPGITGPDARQLDENLRALGHGGFTAAGVRRWQRALGLPQTGEVELGRVLFAPADIRIDSVTAGVSLSTGGGEEVLRYTGTARQVTVLLEVSKQRLARKDAQVQIRLPDARTVAGRIERVSTVVEQPAAPDAQPLTMIEAIVALADPAAAAGIEAAVVTVVFTAAERRDVLTVPVAALVALAEGGYGLEVVDGDATHYMRVETGLFASGRVEVTGDGLREGLTVGMPK